MCAARGAVPCAGGKAMAYRPVEPEASWAAGSSAPARAELCIVVAAALNLLDAGILRPLLARGCCYGSQSVTEELRGAEAVGKYLGEKIDALRSAGPDSLVTCELAADPGGRPCVLVRQRSSAFGRPGLGSVEGFYRVDALPDGSLGRLFMVTCVPPPGLCRGAGLFPGLGEADVRGRREHEGERIPLSDEVTFLLFAKPRVSACDEMVRALPALREDYRPAKVTVVTPANREACLEHGISGFPTLLVRWRGRTVRTLDGYLTPEQLRAELADLFEGVPAP